MSDLHSKTVHELAELLQSGQCCSVDLVEALEARICRIDPQVQAYVERDVEDALAQARVADQRRAAGERGPLLGVPVAIKDLLNVRGQSCRCGSQLLRGYTSPYDATAVARLRAQGAVLFGRVNMDEFAMGSSTENSSIQTTRNPWALSRVPGGSSGGSAAAVASETAFVSLGSDTGGSVRQPAAFCGCVGLKPSYGRVSRYGLTAYASSLDQIGVLSRDVRDAAELLQGIAGHDPLDSTSVPRPVPSYSEGLERGVKGMRVGLAPDFFAEGLDAEVGRAVRAAIAQVEALGAEVVEVSFPHLHYAVSTYYILAAAEASANLARFDGVRYGARVDGEDPISLYGNTREAGFGAEVKRRILLGTYVLSSGYYDAFYLRAQKVRALLRRDFSEVFARCDVLLTPVAPTAAFRIGEAAEDPLQMYLGDVCTVPVNLAGCCGISVPCGFTDAGLPVGLQVIGPAFGEAEVLRVARAYEQATDWHLRRPALVQDGGGA